MFFRGMEMHLVGEYRAQWGEGPIWTGGRLVYVDIEGKKVISYDPESGREVIWEVGQRVGTVVPRRGGGFVIGGDHGFSFLDEESGQVTAIFDPEPDKVDNRLNDGKCSPDGYFFAGSISLVKKTGDAALYRLDPDLEVSQAYGPVTNSNGIAWSKDGGACYYIDTPSKEVKVFQYDRGVFSGERVAFSTAHREASPDGMCLDDEGNLWIAFCHGGCVVCFDPETGQELRVVEVPCLETTACTFGGQDLEDLYVTTGIHKTEVEEHAGRLWVVKGLGVRGVRANEFWG